MQNVKKKHTPKSLCTKPENQDMEETVMQKIRSGNVKMKPRWYFVVGSAFFLSGLIGISTGAMFFVNLTLFLLRSHGPMGQWRLEMMIASFPLWVPGLAIVLLAAGILLLRRYDFSYTHNFFLIIMTFLISVVVSAYLIDSLGINESWSRQGPMRRLYQQFDSEGGNNPDGRGRNGYGRGNSRFR